MVHPVSVTVTGVALLKIRSPVIVTLVRSVGVAWLTFPCTDRFDIAPLAVMAPDDFKAWNFVPEARLLTPAIVIEPKSTAVPVAVKKLVAGVGYAALVPSAFVLNAFEASYKLSTVTALASVIVFVVLLIVTAEVSNASAEALLSVTFKSKGSFAE
jgi:hypothetical protein